MGCCVNFVIASTFLLVLTGICLAFALQSTQGHFSYALDDPFIHMSIVKNFVEQGIWSVDGHSMSSASSSPFWVLLLSPFYLLFGPSLFLYVPFALNILFQILSLRVIFALIKKHTGKELHYLFGIGMILITPFIALSFGGMEHSLQILLVLLFINRILYYITDPKSQINMRQLLVLAPFIVFTRYENIALIVALSIVIFIYFKNWKFALLLVISSLLFVTAFGLLSTYMFDVGFIPSSIIIKSYLAPRSLIGTFMARIYRACSALSQGHLAVLWLANMFIGLIGVHRRLPSMFILPSVFALTLLAHALFAKTGWLFRYEAYLVVMGFVSILIFFYSIDKREVTYQPLIIMALMLPLGFRALAPLRESVIGCRNIYEQQIQMANLLKSEYNSSQIAANDIGAITYFTEIHLLDLYGLASQEVVALKKENAYNSSEKNRLLRESHVELIVVYDSWFEGAKFDNYTKIIEWRIANNVVCGDSTVSFYSRNDKVEENYVKIKNYSKKHLPKSVQVTLKGAEK